MYRFFINQIIFKEEYVMAKEGMNLTTADMDMLFNQGINGFGKGVQMVSHVAQTIDNNFGSDSRRNTGGYFQSNNYGYGYNMPQQPVQYGYGYAASNPNYGWGSFNGYNNMYESSYDGFWNPAYGQMNGGY
jgi:hypothetical protein